MEHTLNSAPKFSTLVLKVEKKLMNNKDRPIWKKQLTCFSLLGLMAVFMTGCKEETTTNREEQVSEVMMPVVNHEKQVEPTSKSMTAFPSDKEQETVAPSVTSMGSTPEKSLESIISENVTEKKSVASELKKQTVVTPTSVAAEHEPVPGQPSTLPVQEGAVSLPLSQKMADPSESAGKTEPLVVPSQEVKATGTTTQTIREEKARTIPSEHAEDKIQKEVVLPEEIKPKVDETELQEEDSSNMKPVSMNVSLRQSAEKVLGSVDLTLHWNPATTQPTDPKNVCQDLSNAMIFQQGRIRNGRIQIVFGYPTGAKLPTSLMRCHFQSRSQEIGNATVAIQNVLVSDLQGSPLDFSMDGMEIQWNEPQ